jgi:hypothetical protein
MVAILVGLVGCGGGSPARTAAPVVGAASPEEAVEAFLDAAREAQSAKAAGEHSAAGRAYDKMAGVFGTEQGSISRSYPAQEVRDRMVVLAACLRPTAFRVITQPDPEAWREKKTVVTAELRRDGETLSLPFRCVLGRGDRWYIEQIQLSISSFAC